MKDHYLTDNNQMSNLAIAPDFLPMKNHLVMSTVDLDELESFINKEVILEKRSLIPLSKDSNINGHLSHVSLNHIEFMGVHIGSDIIAKSVPLKVAQVIIPMHGRIIDYTGNNQIMITSPETAIVHSPNESVQVVWGNDTAALAIRIQEHYLEQIYNTLYGNVIPNDFTFLPTLDLTRGEGLSLANIIQSILKELAIGNEFLNIYRVLALWEELFTIALFNSQPQTTTNQPLNNIQPVYYYVKKATDYMMANLTASIKISDLVKESGVALRTLQAGFHKCHGMGPMTFLRQRKLEKVYRELLSSSQYNTRVRDVAAKWGFFHASHFAQQYYKYFAELPSETLIKKEKSIYITRNRLNI